MKAFLVRSLVDDPAAALWGVRVVRKTLALLTAVTLIGCLSVNESQPAEDDVPGVPTVDGGMAGDESQSAADERDGNERDGTAESQASGPANGRDAPGSGDDLPAERGSQAAGDGASAPDDVSVEGDVGDEPMLDEPMLDGPLLDEPVADDGAVTVQQSDDGHALPFRVVDAEYSRELEQIVMVSAEPNRLIMLDPASGEFAELPLNLLPSSVSVGPDGLSAAVGHNGYITVVALRPLAEVDVLTVSADLSDVVLSGNGYVYGFPRIDQWVDLHSVELATGDETSSYGLRAGTVGRLHPSGDRMYGADRGLSPSDIERYDIAEGTAVLSYDSPYHGDYPMCGDLWFSEDGARIFTACGYIFRASNVREDDMTYNGSLEGGPSVQHLASSSAAGLVAVVHRQNLSFGQVEPAQAGQLTIYGGDFLGQRQSLDLPRFEAGGTEYASEGRFLFFNSSGTRLYALVEAEAAAPLVNNYGLVQFVVEAGEVTGGQGPVLSTRDGDPSSTAAASGGGVIEAP